jgi:hypothetical protein
MVIFKVELFLMFLSSINIQVMFHRLYNPVWVIVPSCRSLRNSSINNKIGNLFELLINSYLQIHTNITRRRIIKCLLLHLQQMDPRNVKDIMFGSKGTSSHEAHKYSRCSRKLRFMESVNLTRGNC